MSLMLIHCKKEKSSNAEQKSTIEVDSSKNSNNDSISISKEESLKNINNKILETLKAKNYAQFSEYIHPDKGITFSMYSYLEANDKHFSKTEFEKFVSSNIKFTWGEKDGSGESLILPIKKYLENWVFTEDFTESEYFQDEFKGSGNSLNNISEKFPNLHFTENYIPGTKKYGEMDWGSLIFVFEEFEGKNYLVGVINNFWTI